MLTNEVVSEVQQFADLLMVNRKPSFDPMVSDVCQTLAESFKLAQDSDYHTQPPSRYALDMIKDVVKFSS